MPIPNSRGDVIGGVAGVPGWLNAAYYPFNTYGSGDFIDDDTLIVIDATVGGITRVWKPWADPYGENRQNAFGAANDVAAGGGKVICWTPGGLAGSVGTIPGAGGPGRGTGSGGISVAPDGTIAFKTLYQSGAGVTIIPPGNTRQWPPSPTAVWPRDLPAEWGWIQIPNALPVDIQAVRGGKAIWRDGAYGRPPVRPFYGDAMGVRLATVAGVDYLLYWTNALPGLVFQPDGLAEGRILDQEGLAFGWDMIGGPVYATIVSSRTQGEGPNDLCKIFCNQDRIDYPIDWKAGRPTPPWQALPLIQPAPPPIVPIGRVCWMAWFTDGAQNAPGNSDLFVDYHAEGKHDNILRRRDGKPAYLYVAAEQSGTVAGLEAELAKERLNANGLPLLAYLTPGLQNADPLPRGADVYLIEAYWKTSETLEQLEARMRRVAARCPRAGFALQCYTSNTTNTSDLKAVVPVYSRVVRDMRNVEVMAVFSAGSRATGWDQHPEVHESWQTLANGVTGTPPLPIIPITPPVVIPPTPPKPKPLYKPATRYHEVSMSQKVLRMGSFFAQILPSSDGKGPFGWYAVTFTKDRSDPNCVFEVSSPDNNKLLGRHVATQSAIGADATEFLSGGNVCAQLYGKPNLSEADWGGYEAWDGWELDQGRHIMLVEYDREDGKSTSLCFTVEDL